LIKTSVMLILSKRCNMRCPYCYYHDNDEYNGDMSDETFYKVMNLLIEYINKYNLQHFTLEIFGGEPFVEEDRLIELITTIHKSTPSCLTRYMIATNGSFDLERFNKKTKGIWINIKVTYDGNIPGYPKNHLENLIYWDSLNRSCHSSTVLSTSNASSMYDIWKTMREHDIVELWVPNIDELLVNYDELSDTIYNQLNKIYDEMERDKYYTTFHVQNKLKTTKKCSAGIDMFSIGLQGELFSCWHDNYYTDEELKKYGIIKQYMNTTDDIYYYGEIRNRGLKDHLQCHIVGSNCVDGSHKRLYDRIDILIHDREKVLEEMAKKEGKELIRRRRGIRHRGDTIIEVM